MKRAIVIFPRFDDPSAIEQLRLQFDPLALQIKDHLTLVFAFESGLPTPQLYDHTKNAIHGQLPFKAQFQHITGHEGKYLFLNVKQGNDNLVALHDRLHAGILAPYLSHEHTWMAHITIGRLADRANFIKSLETVKPLHNVYRILVNKVAVIQADEDYRTEFKIP